MALQILKDTYEVDGKTIKVLNPLKIAGPHSYKAKTYDDLEIVLNDIREFITSVTNTYVSITSITPIIMKQSGNITGTVTIKGTDVATAATVTTNGTYTLSTPISLDSTIEYLLIYDVSAKED
jgi:tRNA U34 5-carboxymethylaminomethyl modifying enzyme MnmG/GidA